MGQTLSSAAQWTAVKDGTGQGRLEYTPTNDAIINKIIDLVEKFPSSHPDESQYTFKQPLTWKTGLKVSQFSDGYKLSDGLLESEDTGANGQPMLRIRAVDGGERELSVSSFQQLYTVLQISGDEKKKETRRCLEANRDPISCILGDRFAAVSGTDESIYRFVDEIMSATPTDDDGQVERQSKLASLRLLLMLRDFDDRLTRAAIKDIAIEVRLSPADVSRAMEILKRFCGPDSETHLLKNIEWTPPYSTEYKGGSRAPFTRQVGGDIAYITVHTHSTRTSTEQEQVIYVTASTSGYFINGGIDEEKRDLRFEAQSQYYRDLVMLLRDNDEHFAKFIDQSDIYHQNKRSHSSTSRLSSNSSTNSAIHQSNARKGKAHDKKDERNDSGRDQVDGRVGPKDKKVEQKRNMEYSSKWKILGLDERKEEREKKDMEKEAQVVLIEKKKVHKQSGEGHKGRGSEKFETSSSESEEDEEVMWRYLDSAADLPSEYWQIQKLIRYLKGGNQTATIIALCSLLDFDLEQETCQLAIRDVGGLEILINLLDTDRDKCKIGALKILKEISKNANIRRAIADLGAIEKMIGILEEHDKELKCLAAETIANVAKFRRARRAVRHKGGIQNIVSLLSHSSPEVARSGALALWSCCCSSERNKEAARQAGAIPQLGKLLKSHNTTILIPVVGTLQECCNDPVYRKAVRTEGMIVDLVRNLKANSVELQTLSANALFKCAEDKQTRDLIRQYNGLDPLVDLVNKADNNRDLLAAATGAIWKCAISPENVEKFQKLGSVELLVALLSHQSEEVLVNAAGALAELVKNSDNRVLVRKCSGLPQLVQLLTGTNRALLVNATKATGLCAEDPENMVIIDRLDGVRLLWSLLKNKNEDVQAHAAWAICPCIENTKDAGEMVRSFVGGLELIVGLLGSENNEVLAAVCAAIANIANDEENLAVITDHGVVPRLAALTPTTDDKLRQYLAEAIARCCNWSNNRVTFGKEGAVPYLVRYLSSPRTEVHRSTARALHQLSKHPDNCISMHSNGIVKPLLQLIGSDDHVLQEASAGCLSNIRRLALANEKARHQKQAESREKSKKVKNRQAITAA